MSKLFSLFLMLGLVSAGNIGDNTLKCDSQNSNFVDCPGTGPSQPCANTVKDTMSETGCGALFLYPCYQCCVDDADPGCASNWANCGYNSIGGTSICPSATTDGKVNVFGK